MFTNAKLRIMLLVLSAIGLIDSAYLTWVKLTHGQAFCGGSGECQSVANSPYSEIAGIPISIIGMGAYLVLIVVLYLEARGGFWGENSPLIVFGLTLAGTIYSAYLTFLELYVIHAICPYCVASAVVMVLMFIISVLRLFMDQTEANPIRNRGG